MAKYLLIESKDSYESGSVAEFFELARGLASAGNDVTLFLVQNGVLTARAIGSSSSFDAVAASGVEILADDFSLAERGIVEGKLDPKVKSAPLEVVVDHLAEGRKVLWH